MQVLGLIVWMFQYMDAENESITDGGVYKLQQNKKKQKNNDILYQSSGLCQNWNLGITQ